MATVVHDFPHAVRVIENTWITLSDGTRLAAKIWLPDDADRDPVPAVLEFLPYRKRDGTAARDQLLYPYLAGHGYAGVRVDLRCPNLSLKVLPPKACPRTNTRRKSRPTEPR